MRVGHEAADDDTRNQRLDQNGAAPADAAAALGSGKATRQD
jgi:hypothetical protein